MGGLFSKPAELSKSVFQPMRYMVCMLSAVASAKNQAGLFLYKKYLTIFVLLLCGLSQAPCLGTVLIYSQWPGRQCFRPRQLLNEGLGGGMRLVTAERQMWLGQGPSTFILAPLGVSRSRLPTSSVACVAKAVDSAIGTACTGSWLGCGICGVGSSGTCW